MKTIRDVMNIKISDMDLSVRANNCLRNLKVDTLEELTKRRIDEISSAKNVGKKTIEEIQNIMNSMELFFCMTERDWAAWGLSHLSLVKSI